MIVKLTIHLDLPKEYKTTNISSTLHGVLMESLPSEKVESIHQLSYNPLKQRLIFDKDQATWEIICFSSTISQDIIQFVSQQTSLFIKHYQLNVDILSFNVERIDIQSLINQSFTKDKLSRIIKLKIVTPMSFKSKGQYDIFLDIRKIFRSIMLQYDSFFKEYDMYDRDTLNYIEENIKIIDYQLWSTKFHLEGVKIPSFKGNVVLKINGPLPFQQLIHFLIQFGELTGAGIKTSLGMGKYTLSNKK
ncbi:CRISPR system precrRNA processing endoribonuclease RAMP protein Cas6 [Staphylococcus simulans]